MSRHICFVLGLVLACGCLGGCGRPTERLNSPPQGTTDKRNKMQPFFIYMTDNATMADMSIADIHFVPNTAELNSLGTERLSRVVQLIEAYGGTVRYATAIQDEEMVGQRIDHVRDYLAQAGADMERTDVTVAMAGSSDTPAAEAIEAKEKGRDSTFVEITEE